MKSTMPARESGAAAVELALVSPILFAMIFGIVEFGLLWSFKAELNNATAISARGFIVDSGANPTTTAKSIITSSVAGVSAADISICLTSGTTTNCSSPKCTDDTTGAKVTVTVATERSAVTKIIPGQVDVSSKFVALCQ